MTGVVASVNRAVREAIVAHDDIPGFMPPMTMPFPIKDDVVLASLERGDQIAGTLVVGETHFRLEGVKVTRKAPAGVPPAPSPEPGAALPQKGDLLPDVTLLDQDGKALRLLELRGKVLAITFIFTRCPLPDFCPRMGAHFGAVDQLVATDRTLLGQIRLLSVSFDPKFDTPEMLQTWGRRYFKTFERARLLTGDPAEIRRLASFLSVEYDGEGAGLTHNLRTAVVDKEGRLFSLVRGNDWTPETLLADLKAAAAP
jgi:protein SCO1/2